MFPFSRVVETYFRFRRGGITSFSTGSTEKVAFNWPSKNVDCQRVIVGTKKNLFNTTAARGEMRSEKVPT